MLLVFRGLLRRRRTTVVAAELGLSQSAVSHALTRLRDLFGDQLFLRRPHGLEPTRRAQELGPHIDVLIDQIGVTLERRTGFDAARSTRLFSISAPEFVSSLIGAELVGAFRQLAPRAQFGIRFLSQSVALEALGRGELDVALGRFGQVSQGFASERLYADHYCVAARRSHPAIRGGRITSAQYKSLGHVFAYSESETGVAEGAMTTPEIAFTAAVPGWLVVLSIVAGSDAIATAPRRLVERQAKRLGLQIVKPPFAPQTIEVDALHRLGDRDGGVEWLLAQIRKAVAGER